MGKGNEKMEQEVLILRKQRNFISLDIITLHYVTQSQLNKISLLSLLYPLTFIWGWKLKYVSLHSPTGQSNLLNKEIFSHLKNLQNKDFLYEIYL